MDARGRGPRAERPAYGVPLRRAGHASLVVMPSRRPRSGAPTAGSARSPTPARAPRLAPLWTRRLPALAPRHGRSCTDYAGSAIFVQVNEDEFEPAPLARPDVPVGDAREGQPELPGRWTPEDDRRLIAAYRAGQNVDQLARIFRCRPSAIELRLRTLALLVARRNRYRY